MQAVIYMAFYPIIPLAFLVAALGDEIDKIVSGGEGGLSWQKHGPGAIFFAKPESTLGAFFWQQYLCSSMYVGNFLMSGNHELAIKHTLHDSVLTKHVWRKHLENVGAFVPPAAAVWDGESQTLKINDTSKKSRAIIKINDGFLGGGDKILKDFSLETAKDKAWLEDIFKSEYKG